MQISRKYRVTYGQFHPPSIIWECRIITKGLYSEDTEASAKYVRSALLCPSLRLEETDRAVRTLPRTAPPKMSTAGMLAVSMTKGKEEAGRGMRWKVRCAAHQLNLLEPS